MQKKVFVGNLNYQTTEDDLRELFSQAGEVASVSIPTDRMTGRPRGFAFIEFATTEAATVAIERFNDHDLTGRKIRVNEATERTPRSGPDAGGAEAPPRRFTKPKGSRRNLRAKKRGF